MSDKPLTDAEIAELRALLDAGELTLSVEAADALPRLLDTVDRARALLKRIEWSARVNDLSDEPITEEQACPECLALKRDGTHAPGCELAALIGGK